MVASSETELDVGQIISASASAYICGIGADGGLLDLIIKAWKNELYSLSDAEQKDLWVTNEGRIPAGSGLYS